MKIITICGMIGATKPNPDYPKSSTQKYIQKSVADKALYTTKIAGFPTLKKEHYTNMLPLLADNFDAQVVALATKKAEKIQQDVLAFEQLESTKVNFEEIKSESEGDDTEYMKLFAQINTLLNDSEDEVIVDLSHGFRHIPLLTLVALIVTNIKDTKKIKQILFAKEIEKDKKYEIVELSEYLDIATVSYALNSFAQNYTIANEEHLRTDTFKPLFKALNRFSQHILANSISALFEQRLVDNVLNSIKSLQTHAYYTHLQPLLAPVQIHLTKINSYRQRLPYEQLYFLSEVLFARRYYLNAITLLSESIAAYLYEHFKRLQLLKEETMEYNVLKAVVEFVSKESINTKYLNINDIYFYCHNEAAVMKPLAVLIEDVRDLRNDLAHANGQKALEDIEQQIGKLYAQYKQLIEKEDKAQYLSTKTDAESEACRYAVSIFERWINSVMYKLFQNVGFKTLFEKNRLSTIENDEKLPASWNIPQKRDRSQQQNRFLKLCREYLDVKNNKQQRKEVMQKFYQEFSYMMHNK